MHVQQQGYVGRFEFFRFAGLTREWSFSNSHNFFDSRDHSQFAQISIFLDSMIDLTQDLIEEYEQ